MHSQKPEIAARWDEKYGRKIMKKKPKKKKKGSYARGYLDSY